MSKEVEDKIGDGFEFDIHFYGDAGRRYLIEYIDNHAKEVAIGFQEFLWEAKAEISNNGTTAYINANPHGIKAGYYDISQLYQQYLNQRGNDIRQGNEVKG